MKTWLVKHLTKRETSLDKAIDIIINFEWLNKIQTPDSNEQSANKTNEADRLTYEEYKTTKS